MKRWMSLVALLVLGLGCKKNNPGPQPEVSDKYGNPPSALKSVYERPGTSIRIDFLKTLNPEAGFSDDEIALIKAALNTLTDDELSRLDIHVMTSDYVPNQAKPQMMYSNDPIHVKAIYFNQPVSRRPLNQNIGNDFLAYLGYPERRISLSSTVYNDETHQQLFPEVLSDPIPMPSMSVPALPKAEPLLFPGRHVQVIGSESPSHYVTLTSRAGHNALTQEVRAAGGKAKDLSVDDQVRPHGGIRQ